MDNQNQPTKIPEVQTQTPPPINNSSNTKLLILILIGVAVTLVAIGAYTLGTKQSQPVVQNAVQTTPIPSPTSVDETANWKTYTNKEYGFSIEYPSKWYVVDYEDDKNKHGPPDLNRLVFLLFGKGTPPDYALTHPWGDLSIIVYKTPFSEETINRNEIAKYSQLNNDNSLNEVDGTKHTPTQFMGLKANKKIQLSPDMIDGNLGTNIYFNANGYGWDIHYPAIDYQGNSDPIYDQILSTFRFSN